ncbi:hypothetical protein MSPP1_001323 [Malassezia sp. CBS 17886]|nr:hypothetical protein MSPP1_001323 [Malassezia sp. CBS 17886]
MVKLSAPLALLAVAVAGVLAADPSNGNGSQAASAAPSAAASAPAEQSSAPPAPTSAPAPSGAASGGGGGGDDSSKSGVCSELFGDPHVHMHDCHESSTVVPPYNLSSLVSYFVEGYDPGKQGHEASEVARELAGSVFHFYPTATASSSVVVQAFFNHIGDLINSHGQNSINAALSHHAVLPAAMATVAMVAAGAVLL